MADKHAIKIPSKNTNDAYGTQPPSHTQQERHETIKTDAVVNKDPEGTR